MDASRFDTISRIFASRRTRRGAVAGAAGIAAVMGASTLAQDATPESSIQTTESPDFTFGDDPHASADDAAPHPEYLFVQSFESGAWAPKAGEDGTYTLTIAGDLAQTIYFSDRPDRIFGQVPTERLLAALGFTPDNPPNAAVVAQRAGGDGQEVLVIELMNPAYDAGASTLTYDARVLADYGEHPLAHAARQQQDYNLPESFAEGGLFIDDCPDANVGCVKEVNGEMVHVGSTGPYTNTIGIGTCYDWAHAYCFPCDEDPRSAHYGQLCAQAFPDQCSYGHIGNVPGTSWDCFIDELYSIP